MTRKVYKSAMGKEVDLGALLLRNEDVRAVGNMNVNARGDLLDSTNKAIDQKNRQVQRQHRRNTTNVSSSAQVNTSSKSAKQAQTNMPATNIQHEDELLDENIEMLVEEPEQVVIPPTGSGGLAAAIARSRLIKQEKEKTLREKAREQAIKRI